MTRTWIFVVAMGIFGILSPHSSLAMTIKTPAGATPADFPTGPNAIIPMATLDLGVLWGKLDVSRTGRVFYGFHGIPYAQPPKRFEPSVPVQPWGGLRDARHPGSACPQLKNAAVYGQENCLFLNVFHPFQDLCQNVTDTGKLPVMVSIHGGGFTAGQGDQFNPKYILDECVVLVTINYRLGALGFLATDDGVLPGNLGLKDQVLALQWVQKYIGEFRGDKDLVTVMGVSAGGSSVAHLIVSPSAKGLIHRGIAQSGTALNPWSIARTPTKTAQKMAELLKCPVETTAAIKTCLEKKTLREIISAQQGVGGFIELAPVVESANAVNPFHTEHPVKRLRSGDFNQVPIITGFVQDEGITLYAAAFLANANWTAKLNDDWNAQAPATFLYHNLNLTQEAMDTISGKIREFYFGNEKVGKKTRQALTNLFSDRLFVQGTFETAELHSKFAPVYPYVLSYKGGVSSAFGQGYLIPSCTHGDDMQFLSQLHPLHYGTEQYEFSRNLVKLWTSFAKTGRPEGRAPTLDTWPVVQGRGNSRWFHLNVPTRVEDNYLEERRKFWEGLGLYDTELN